MTSRMKDNELKGIFILGLFIVLTVQSIFESKAPEPSPQIKIEHNLSDDLNNEENNDTEPKPEVRTFKSTRQLR